MRQTLIKEILIMKKYGLQIYSVRDQFTNEEDTKNAFLALAEMGYTSVQTAGTYDYISPEKFAQYAKDAGIEICGTHYNWDLIKGDVEGTIAYHKTLGTTNIGVGGMPMYARKDLDGLNTFINEFNSMAKIYHEHGFKLTYHNHSFEFVKLPDGKTLFDHLVEKLDPECTSFVLDTYWVQHGGADVRATIERLNGRIDILHLKDMEACHGYTLANGNGLAAPAIIEIGAGNINFKDIIPTAEKCGVKYFVVEDDRAPSTGDSLAAVKKSADYINANLLEK